MRYSAHHLPIPAGAAQALYTRYPKLRVDLVTNSHIPVGTWDHLNIDKMKSRAVEYLVTHGDENTVKRVLASRKRTVGIIDAILSTWRVSPPTQHLLARP